MVNLHCKYTELELARRELSKQGILDEYCIQKAIDQFYLCSSRNEKTMEFLNFRTFY